VCGTTDMPTALIDKKNLHDKTVISSNTSNSLLGGENEEDWFACPI